MASQPPAEASPASSTNYAYDHWDDTRPEAHGYLTPCVLQELSRLPAGARILDLGCGNGAMSVQIHKQGHQVCGLDLSESGVAQARKLLPQFQFEVASVYDDLVQLFGGQFDAVVSLEVVEHLYDPRTYARRIHEALRPGGIAIISTPYHGWAKNILIAALGKHDFHFNPLYDGGHIKFWSRQTLTRLFTDQGFEVLKFIGTGRIPWVWKSMVLVIRRPAAANGSAK